MFQLLKQYLLVITPDHVALPVNLYRSGDVCLNVDKILFLTRAVHPCWPTGEHFYLLTDADRAAGARDQVLAEIDITVILRGAE